MRIIAGEYRGRTVLAPKDDATRPITDRAKQSLFDVLTPHMDGARVFDICCGTGSLGLECLSRGCDSVVFFEQHAPAIALLNRNLQALGPTAISRAEVVAGDVFRPATLARRAAPGPTLIFLDPPYRYLVESPGPLQELALRLAQLAGEGAVLCFRHDDHDVLPLVGWATYRKLVYGGMAIELMAQSVATSSDR